MEERKRRYFLLQLDEEKTSTLNKVPLKTTQLQTLDELWGNLTDMRPDKAQGLREQQHLHVSLQLLQQCWVLVQAHEGLAEASGQHQDPRTAGTF